MVILFSFLIFLLFAAGLSFAGMKLYVKPKEAIERVAGTGLDGHDSAPVHPSLVFHDMVKRLGALVPASPKDVTVMQRRLIRASQRLSGSPSTFARSVLLACRYAADSTISRCSHFSDHPSRTNRDARSSSISNAEEGSPCNRRSHGIAAHSVKCGRSRSSLL